MKGRRTHVLAFLLLALTILLASSKPSLAESPQLSFGDKLSIFSDKAYRKGNKSFEAVGNVVIISGKDTVYGELASLNQETMMAKIEGNVRLITKDMTLYGSHLEYNIALGTAVIRNARIITSQFNLVAQRLIRVSEKEYIAHEAEFTTCKDCAESWAVYGKMIRVQVNKQVEITKGLARIKGANVLYIPYIVLPMSKRKSGLLFPVISQRSGEGMGVQQPIFWAIDDSKDATITPASWAKRGYGTDLEYRQRFREMRWLTFNSRLLNDAIYQPGQTNVAPSGKNFFRHFSDVETHQQFSPNLGSHIRFSEVRDLDVLRDHFQYTEPKVNSSELGLNGNVHYRQDWFSVGAQSQYMRNMLVSDPTFFDRGYVQTLPRLDISTIPYTLVQSRTPGLNHVALGFDGSYTRFRQVDNNEDTNPYLRNADRISTQPYLLWNFFTWGPVSFKSRYIFDQQAYAFEEQKEAGAGKNAGLVRSEISFTMDKIFGLAYEEKVPIKNISEEELKRLRERKEQGLAPIQTNDKENRLVGDLPTFQSELAKDAIIEKRNSYRHSQEFKFIHHYISSQNTYGNKRFVDNLDQQRAWFDYEDAIRSQEYLYGSNITRTIIPPQNTVEFQWNNTLIRKSPKQFSFLEDDKYLRDNFAYTKTGYFNVSQGYLLNVEETDDYRDRLTRLMVDTGYFADRWNVSLQEFYFHRLQENIFNLSFNRRFSYINIMSAYRYSSASKLTPGSTETNVLSFGTQVRPTDVLGLSILKGLDFNADKKEVLTVYSADFMPHNNCWILNFNFQQRNNVSRYSANIIWNFGQAQFERYRTDYFSVQRL